MATLNVLYFARVREVTGLASESLTVPDDATVHDAITLIAARHAGLAPLLPSLRVALAGEFVAPNVPVIDGAELVLIPPVSGGVDDKVALVDTPLDEAPLMHLVGGSGDGAVVLFVGKVRDHARGRAVEVLEYEAYPTMALSEMRKLVATVEATFGAKVAIHHRVGRLVVGDVAVLAAAGHAHRGPAFDACRELIEGLKRDVPIWKKEIGPDGAEWVSDRP